MDAEVINRLKAWFYLRLAPEDWSKFGASASQVLQDFDCDPDQENALLRFADVVVLLEIRKLKDPRLVRQVSKRRAQELLALGLTREQLRKVAGDFEFLVEIGYLEPVRDSQGQLIYRNGEPVYRKTEKGRQLDRQFSSGQIPPLPP
jgi:hypothetical protein